MIPNTAFTIWLSDKAGYPAVADYCIASQKAFYNNSHIVLTMENKLPDSRYFKECIQAKKWIKASDYLRMWYLHEYGGVYMDADMELLKPLDKFLNAQMFVGQESNGIFANSIVGSVAGHPLLKEYLRRLDANFRGDGDLTFEPGIRAFADLIWLNKYDVTVYPPETFFSKDYTIHHEMRSWVK